MPLAEPLVMPQNGATPAEQVHLRSERFHSSPQVLSARAGDTVVLMDRKRGTYFALNEVGGKVWESVVAGATVTEMVEQLLREYDVHGPDLERDVAATVQQLHSARLIAVGQVSRPVHKLERVATRTTQVLTNISEVRVPSVFKCALMIFVVKAMLKTRGFAWTTEWVCQRAEGVPIRNDVDDGTVRAIEHRVAMAAALYPGRALCLEQSLTLYYYFLCAGIQSVFRLGTKPHPFESHAWVERFGEPVNDLPEHVVNFVPFPHPLS